MIRNILLHVLVPLFVCGSITTIAEKANPNSVIGDLATLGLVAYWLVLYFAGKSKAAEESRMQEVERLHQREKLATPPPPPELR